ncbi:MAG: hypothetical protein K9K76_01815, partial [Halanaerobiales bacterium]|nr:hypothetical protein [Halanaerobiales bacterium]
ILIPGKCLISRHHGSYFNMLEGLSSLIRAYPSSKPKKPCIKPCNLNNGVDIKYLISKKGVCKFI